MWNTKQIILLTRHVLSEREITHG